MMVLVRINRCLILVIILVVQNITMIQNTLVFRKMKNEMGGVAIKKVVGLKPKMYSILLSNSYEYRKAKNVNKNVVARIRHCL